MREDKRGMAVTFLYQYLRDKEIYSGDVKIAAEAAGIKYSTLRRASKNTVIAFIGDDKGRWYWKLRFPPVVEPSAGRFFVGLENRHDTDDNSEELDT